MTVAVAAHAARAAAVALADLGASVLGLLLLRVEVVDGRARALLGLWREGGRERERDGTFVSYFFFTGCPGVRM